MAKLPNAPLQEVIFEVRWALQPSQDSRQMIDAGFELASGRLSTIVENEMPVYKRITPTDIPDQLLLYNAVHQYWKGEKTWPVIQLGPGIFTVNCTDDWYDWEETFYPFIQTALKWLVQSYRTPLQFVSASLRYIDGINVKEYGGIDNGWEEFINKHFNFLYKNNFEIQGKAKQIQINQVFELEDNSTLQIQLSDGKRKNELALIWQTAILKRQKFSPEELIKWTNDVHLIIHNLFKEMLKPDTYASFSRKNEN